MRVEQSLGSPERPLVARPKGRAVATNNESGESASDTSDAEFGKFWSLHKSYLFFWVSAALTAVSRAGESARRLFERVFQRPTTAQELCRLPWRVLGENAPGPSGRSHQLLVTLGIIRSRSRPHAPDTNSFSESQVKMLRKRTPKSPGGNCAEELATSGVTAPLGKGLSLIQVEDACLNPGSSVFDVRVYSERFAPGRCLACCRFTRCSCQAQLRVHRGERSQVVVVWYWNSRPYRRPRRCHSVGPEAFDNRHFRSVAESGPLFTAISNTVSGISTPDQP